MSRHFMPFSSRLHNFLYVFCVKNRWHYLSAAFSLNTMTRLSYAHLDENYLTFFSREFYSVTSSHLLWYSNPRTLSAVFKGKKNLWIFSGVFYEFWYDSINFSILAWLSQLVDKLHFSRTINAVQIRMAVLLVLHGSRV